jgi:hypothetical protein
MSKIPYSHEYPKENVCRRCGKRCYQFAVDHEFEHDEICVACHEGLKHGDGILVEVIQRDAVAGIRGPLPDAFFE